MSPALAVGLLLLVASIWAASFGLIKIHLTALDPDGVNALRLLLTLALFLPWLRRSGTNPSLRGRLALIGAVQFGLMYALYTRAYAHLRAYEVALATVMTPLYVTLLDDALERRFRLRFLLAALLATLGTAVSLGLVSHGLGSPSAQGLALVQGANLCFAVGQISYRRLLADRPHLTDLQAFPWCALGAAVVSVAFALPTLAQDGLPQLNTAQMGVLLYLGTVASGLGFFLWNTAARGVNSGTLAVMNDLKIPLGMVMAVVVFGESAAWGRVTVGLVCIALALALTYVQPEARRQGGPREDQEPSTP